MQATLMHEDGTVLVIEDFSQLEGLIGKNEFFWLDLLELDEEGVELLAKRFQFHPLAIEDAQKFGQRPKLEDYDGYVFLVGHGALGLDQLFEVHFFFNGSQLVSVRREGDELVEDVRRRITLRRQQASALPVMSLYRILDALIDSYFPVLERLDDRIDELEDEILHDPSEAQLGTLFTMKRNLVSMRKVVTPERDMMAGLLSSAANFPGMTDEAERYFRDLYDHLIRISDLVDSYRDLLSSAVDTHLSTVSNRLNQVMKQLTIIATVFLPLTFITGFFGQNFAWLVKRIGSFASFIGVGIGLEVLSVVLLFYLFRRRRWL